MGLSIRRGSSNSGHFSSSQFAVMAVQRCKKGKKLQLEVDVRGNSLFDSYFSLAILFLKFSLTSRKLE